ncbi:methyltransferase domain-containing protein [Geodermatophilus sp. DF01-2]|uniref:class I SAM-dependent methyltransferase n=1 Tax=Geodermatophilus sp. DF01-2 TaxID=2559610 RepID=UPI0010746985|nr:methyltransferase domain-containing protein [Geodermatophilus sp. DF01_2]TFV55835.1 methyltransferase domain-containing protein [Geodermatophilus sp. DF01_2]
MALGPGRWLAAQLRLRLLALDVSSVALGQQVVEVGRPERAPSDLGIMLLQADAEQLPLGDQLVDAAICIDSLQSADNAVLLLGELRRVLKRSAPVVVSCWRVREDASGVARSVPARLERNIADAALSCGFVIEVTEVRAADRAAELRLAHRALQLQQDGALEDDEFLHRVASEATWTLRNEDVFERILLVLRRAR